MEIVLRSRICKIYLQLHGWAGFDRLVLIQKPVFQILIKDGRKLL